MKEIKTVIKVRSHPDVFDQEVNRLLQEGWTLISRAEGPAYFGNTSFFNPVLIAYLERELDSNGNIDGGLHNDR